MSSLSEGAQSIQFETKSSTLHFRGFSLFNSKGHKAKTKFQKHRFLPFVPIYIFRDNGIVIETSKLQLVMEIIFSVFVHLSYFLVPRSYFVLDRFISLIIFIVPFAVQPLFFFVGDLRFRTRVKNRGLWKAIKMEILE